MFTQHEWYKPLVLYFTRCKLFAILILKYCLINKTTIHYVICCILTNPIQNKPQRPQEQTIIFGMIVMFQKNKNNAFWNITRTILFGMKQEWTFLKMGNSSSNILNAFEDSLLTIYRGYWELRRIFITFFNVKLFPVHIQRFPTEIMNSGVLAEIFMSLKRVFFLTSTLVLIPSRPAQLV